MKKLGALLTAGLLLLATGCSEKSIYDNGMVTVDLWKDCYITEDYSYNTTTMLLMTGLQDEEPQGIMSLQIETESDDVDVMTAQELYDKETESLDSTGYTEISSESIEGAEWALTSGDIPMSEMYYIYAPDSNTILIFRALLNTSYYTEHREDLLNFLDRVDVYGSRVLVAGEQIQEYYEQQANSTPESAASESSSNAEG